MPAPRSPKLSSPDPRRPGNAVGHRGVVVYLDVPSGSGFPDTTELVDLADTLHELAQDLVPGATTRTEVTLTTRPGPPATDAGIVVDLAEWRVEAGGEDIPLARVEIELLGRLAARPGEPISAERLSATVRHGRPDTTGENSIDVSIRRVRRRLGPHGLVVTGAPGSGYRLESSVTLRRATGHTPPRPGGPGASR